MNRRKFIHSAIAVVGLGPSVPQLISKLRPKEEILMPIGDFNPYDFLGEWKFVTDSNTMQEMADLTAIEIMHESRKS